MWFPNRSDINRAVQAQKMARDWKLRNCTIRVAKTKALISFAVTAKLICAFVFTYADCLFSHEEAHLVTSQTTSYGTSQIMLTSQLYLNMFTKDS